MSAATLPGPIARTVRFYHASIGKKVVIAVTGVALFGFVVGHLLANLQIFLGPEKINAYAELLRVNAGFTWTARSILLIALILHVTSSIQLARLKSKARPVGYARQESIASSYASRTMMWSGPIIFAFIVYHLLHFTFGVSAVHPDFRFGDVYHNVVAGFQRPPVAIAYIVAMLLLGMHLYHGLWSMFQSVGFNHPRYTPLFRRFAAITTVLIVAGNISIPLAVLTGVVS